MRIVFRLARVTISSIGTARAVCLCWFVPCRRLLRAGGGGTAGLVRVGVSGWSASRAVGLGGSCRVYRAQPLSALLRRLLRRLPLVLVFR